MMSVQSHPAHGLPVEKGKAALALEKILQEANCALITFPIGFNMDLDDAVFSRSWHSGTQVRYLVRGQGRTDNQWRETAKPEGPALAYGPQWANSVVII